MCASWYDPPPESVSSDDGSREATQPRPDYISQRPSSLESLPPPLLSGGADPDLSRPLEQYQTKFPTSAVQHDLAAPDRRFLEAHQIGPTPAPSQSAATPNTHLIPAGHDVGAARGIRSPSRSWLIWASAWLTSSHTASHSLCPIALVPFSDTASHSPSAGNTYHVPVSSPGHQLDSPHHTPRRTRTVQSPRRTH